MTHQAKCECEKPILRESSERKGVSESYCARCERPLVLQLTTAQRGA